MRYKDLTEAPQEPDWDTIKSWAKLYGKKHGIKPNYILGLFNHESMIKDVYHPIGDQTFLQDTNNPEKWIKAYGDNPEAHMSYGPGHFSVRALTKVQNSHPELKIGEKNVKDITWNDLKNNNALAAELSVIHFSDLFNDSDNQGSDGEKLLNAYTAKQGSYRGKDKNSQKFGKQFMASINKFADTPFAVATASTGSGYDKMKWKDQEKIAKAGEETRKRLGYDPEPTSSGLGAEIVDRITDPDELNKAIASTMNTITGSEKGEQYHKVPKGYYYDAGGNLTKIDPSKEMTWSDLVTPSDETTTWHSPSTWFPNLGGGPESEEGKNKRIAALNKKKQDALTKANRPVASVPSDTKESKTFKNYLDEVYSQGRSNIPTIKSQPAKDPTAQTVKGQELDSEQEYQTGEPVGKGTVTFTNDKGEVEKEVSATTGTRKRMARQSPGINVRSIG
jgi:hypothetical protein